MKAMLRSGRKLALFNRPQWECLFSQTVAYNNGVQRAAREDVLILDCVRPAECVYNLVFPGTCEQFIVEWIIVDFIPSV